MSWTSPTSYYDVSISVSLGQASAAPYSGIGYLTTKLGDPANKTAQIATAVFTFPNPTGGAVTVFNNLTIGPGTYYLVLYSTSTLAGGWRFSEDPVQTTAPVVTIGSSDAFYHPGFFEATDIFPYPPDLPFVPLYSNEQLVFSVTGNSASSTAPEPLTFILTFWGAFAAYVYKLSRKIFVRHRAFAGGYS